MRSRMSCTISAHQVHQWALQRLLEHELLKPSSTRKARVCTATVVWSILLRAAARLCSVFAACDDLAAAPSQQAVFNALKSGLPKTRKVLENRLNAALVHGLPRRMRRRSWNVAIDWHLQPYYGEPQHSRNELYYGKPRQGTSRFHAYATACIVVHGERYTLAVSWVRRHETTVCVLTRLIAKVREQELSIKRLLLDRAFFNVPVIGYLKQEGLRFVMPAMFRGRPPKKGRPKRGLHRIRRQRVGRYSHEMSNRGAKVEVTIVVAYRTHKNRKDGKRVQQKLLFGVWGVGGTPQEIRELYRKRFGIETSYRQMREARIRTCTPNPHLRLVFVTLGLLLRNIWVWTHAEVLATQRHGERVARLHLLRFRRMLDWITQVVVSQLHDGSMPSVTCTS